MQLQSELRLPKLSRIRMLGVGQCNCHADVASSDPARRTQALAYESCIEAMEPRRRCIQLTLEALL
jgi:hypothetical protein